MNGFVKPIYCDWNNVLTQDEDVDLVFVWQWLYDSTSIGRNHLVKVTIRILSVIANSGGCEQSFSDFGITYTNIQNKLTTEKVHKTYLVKMHLHRAHTAASLTTYWRKWKFGRDTSQQEDDPSPTTTPPLVPKEILVDFRDLMDKLICDSNNDTPEDDDPVPILAVPPSCTASWWHIPLASLFLYAEQVGANCLEFYWRGGLRNIEWEVAAYDLMQGGEKTGFLGGAEYHGNMTESGTSVQ